MATAVLPFAFAGARTGGPPPDPDEPMWALVLIAALIGIVLGVLSCIFYP